MADTRWVYHCDHCGREWDAVYLILKGVSDGDRLYCPWCVSECYIHADDDFVGKRVTFVNGKGNTTARVFRKSDRYGGGFWAGVWDKVTRTWKAKELKRDR